MEERYFVLKGCAGLGDRLITLAWAIGYCLRNGRTLIVDWSDGLFGPRGRNVFFEFFQITGVKTADSWRNISELAQKSVYPALWKNHPEAAAYDLYQEPVAYPKWKRRLVRCLTFGRWSVNGVWPVKPEHRLEIAKGRGPSFLAEISTGATLPLAGGYPARMVEDVVFGADFVPTLYEEILRTNVHFTQAVEKKVTQAATELHIGKDTFGVHVRHTDRSPAAGVDQLIGRLKRDPFNRAKQMFLATDNAGVLQQFRREFPEVLAFYPKHLPEINGVMGLHHWASSQNQPEYLKRVLEESLIDLYVLTQCGHLLYQGQSNFSRLARVWASPGQVSQDWTEIV
ncbi:MAG TPA: hypothetical protein VI895_05940 [Bdellovibrionota bacterium]|nr:hypothetical protein [Bdellovibrionota bacterium]